MCWTGWQTSWKQLWTKGNFRNCLDKSYSKWGSQQLASSSARNLLEMLSSWAHQDLLNHKHESCGQKHTFLILKLWSPFSFENYCILLYFPSCFGWEDSYEFHMIIQGNQFKFIILNQIDSFVIVQRVWVLCLWTKITWHQYII